MATGSGDEKKVKNKLELLPVEENKSFDNQFRVVDENGEDVTPRPLLPDFTEEGKVFKLEVADISSIEYLESLLVPPPVEKEVFDWQLIDGVATKLRDHFLMSKLTPLDKPPRKRLKSRLNVGSVIILKETETTWHLERDIATSFKENEEDYQKTLKENENHALLQKKKETEKGFTVGIQTFNYFLKTKSTQTERVETKDSADLVTVWALEESKLEAQVQPVVQRPEEEAGDESQTLSAVESYGNLEDEATIPQSLEDIPNLNEKLLLAYRALNANTNKKIWGIFKNYISFVEEKSSSSNSEDEPPFAAESDASLVISPQVKRLTVLADEIVKDFTPSCLSWNPADPNIFVVGYVHFTKSRNQPGLVLCWSVKNCEYPERIYRTPAGATSVAFSKTTAIFLAVGMYNGIVSLYDVQSLSHQPLDDNIDNNNRSGGIIWQVCWTSIASTDDKKGKETFVTCSDDGYIIQWTVGNGLHGMLIMQLKSVLNAADQEERLLARFAQGFCMDFKPDDRDIYIVGTDEGLLHQCSTSHAEQYLRSYSYHPSPVHRVKFSTWDTNTFLACCGDWTMTVWNINHSAPVLVLQSMAKSAVLDIDWSSQSSTVLVCVTEKTVEVWDLAYSLVEPIAHMPPVETKGVYPVPPPNDFTCVGFCPGHEAIALGHDNGIITLACLLNMTQVCDADELRLVAKLKEEKKIIREEEEEQ